MKVARTLVLLSLAAGQIAGAQEKKPPDRMSLQAAAQLDAAMLHETLIVQQTNAAVAPYEKTIVKICKEYGIPRAELGATVFVDVDTGAIQHKAPPAPKPTTPPAAAKPDGKKSP